MIGDGERGIGEDSGALLQEKQQSIEEDLRRLVACPQWPDYQPPKGLPDEELFGWEQADTAARCAFTGFQWEHDGTQWLPDLDDPATLGCLRSMVGDFHSLAVDPDDQWRCCIYQQSTEIMDGWFRGATAGEAIVAALLMQWGAP